MKLFGEWRGTGGAALAGTMALALVTAGLVTASAAHARSPNGDYVVAESRFGNGSVVGPVRRTRVGWQVRTPGGSWIHCERSCSETLRVNTVDFWQSEKSTAGDNNAITHQDGVLGKWLQWERGF